MKRQRPKQFLGIYKPKSLNTLKLLLIYISKIDGNWCDTFGSPPKCVDDYIDILQDLKINSDLTNIDKDDLKSCLCDEIFSKNYSTYIESLLNVIYKYSSLKITELKYNYEEKDDVINEINKVLCLLQMFIIVNPFSEVQDKISFDSCSNNLKTFVFNDGDDISRNKKLRKINKKLLVQRLELSNTSSKLNSKIEDIQNYKNEISTLKDQITKMDNDNSNLRETQTSNMYNFCHDDDDDDYDNEKEEENKINDDNILQDIDTNYDGVTNIFSSYNELSHLININTKRLINIIQINRRSYGNPEFIHFMRTLTQWISNPSVKEWGVYFFNMFFLCFTSKNGSSIFNLLHNWNKNFQIYIEIKRKKKFLESRIEDKDKKELNMYELNYIKNMFDNTTKSSNKEVRLEDRSVVDIKCRFLLEDSKETQINPRWINSFFELCFSKNAICCFQHILPEEIVIKKTSANVYGDLLELNWNSEINEIKNLKSKSRIDSSKQHLLNTGTRFNKKTKSLNQGDQISKYFGVRNSRSRRKNKSGESSLDRINMRTGILLGMYPKKK